MIKSLTLVAGFAALAACHNDKDHLNHRKGGAPAVVTDPSGATKPEVRISKEDYVALKSLVPEGLQLTPKQTLELAIAAMKRDPELQAAIGPILAANIAQRAAEEAAAAKPPVDPAAEAAAAAAAAAAAQTPPP